MTYAGFWPRVVAFILDALIASVVVFGFNVVDRWVFDGALGLFVSYQVVDTRLIDETVMREEDGTEIKTAKYVQTRQFHNDATGQYLITIEEKHLENVKTRFVHVEFLQGDENVPGKYRTVTIIFLGFVAPLLYFIGFESSRYQGTPGKLALGLKVTDLAGHRISPGRASGRYFGKFVSALILYIGFIMVAFTARKQGLHDIMARCLVIRKPR